MKMSRRLAGLVAIVAAMSPSLAAQWPNYPKAGAPRTPAGQTDLAAPAPRTPDGRPDLSGLWENRFGGFGGGRGAPAAPPPEGPPAPNFFYAGAGFKEGLPFQPWAAELRKTRTAENAKSNPEFICAENQKFDQYLRGDLRPKP
jgi:hypothetical protein